MAAASVSAADANRYFSRILSDVKRGESCVITSHGRAVARLVPIEPEDRTRAAGKASLLARLSEQQSDGVSVRWTRDELYEDA
jgi:prevent-host-death family protein